MTLWRRSIESLTLDDVSVNDNSPSIAPSFKGPRRFQVPECILNIYQLHVAAIGERRGMTFKHPSFDSIKAVDDELMRLTNRVSDVSVKRGDTWAPTSQALFLGTPKKDTSKGIFYGGVEVGSHGSFHRLRKRSGAVPYVLENDDLSMRDYFYRIEMPPDSALGFL